MKQAEIRHFVTNNVWVRQIARSAHRRWHSSKLINSGVSSLYRLGALARGLESFGFTEAEIALLLGLVGTRRMVAKGEILVEEGDAAGRAFILHDGWAISYKRLPGGNRQIVELRIAGDFMGLKASFLGTSDRQIEAATDLLISDTRKARVLEIVAEHPRLLEFLIWKFARDEAILAEHLANVGGRRALLRIAHFLLELAERLKQVGKGTATRYELPLPQHLLADTLGVTSIHFNRCLGELRRRGLIRFERNVVELLDRTALEALTGFDPGYISAAAATG